MSTLVNPVSLRLGYVRYWNNNWCILTRINYSYLNQQDYYIYKYLEYYFLKFKWFLSTLVIDNIKNIRIFNMLNIYIYIKNQQFCIFLFENYNWVYNYDHLKIRHSLCFFKNLKKQQKYNKNFYLISKNLKYIKFNILKKVNKLNNYFNYIYKINNIRFIYNIFFNTYLYFSKNYFFCYYLNIYKKKIIQYSNFNKNNNAFKNLSEKYFFIIFSFLCYKYFYFWWKSLLKYKLKKVLKQNKIYINIYFILYWITHFSASFLGQYVRHKLLLNYPMGTIMYHLLKLLQIAQKKKIIYGFKLLFSGRFTRKDRKSHYWKSIGWLKYNKTHSFLDYNLTLVILLNSLCGIKVWLTKKLNSYILQVI